MKAGDRRQKTEERRKEIGGKNYDSRYRTQD